MPSLSTRRHGFTLVETVIAITVSGLILAIALPPMSSALHQSQVRRAARVVAADLQLTFSLAAGHGRPVRVTYDAVNQQYTIALVADGTLLRTRILGSESAYDLSSVAFSPTSIDVFPNGMAASALTIALERGGHSRQVTMMRSGMVRVVRP